ncbi:MAG: ATP-binding protein [Draconibacterium sp.]
MNSKKEKQLTRIYDEYIDLMLYDFPIEKINEIVADDIKGFGSTRDEKFVELNRFRQMVIDQRKQAAGIEIEWKKTPINKRISPKEDIAVYTDEFLLSMKMKTGEHIIPLRLSSVFEFSDDTWKLVHIHGSVGVETENDDTWHLNEWKKKNEELQRLVDERTTDLEQKKRELEIEAALERVRSRTMGMQKSGELQEVINLIFIEITGLGVNMDSSYIITHLDKDITRGFAAWVSINELSYASKLHLAYIDHPLVHRFYSAWKEKESQFSASFTKSEKDRYFNHQFKHSPELSLITDERKRKILDGDGWSISWVIMKDAAIIIQRYQNNPFTEEEISIEKRFANVFEQAYIRFIDIQNAETQAREAKKQTSLDRVRGEIASMRSKEDLNRITPVIWRELQALEVPFFRCGVFIFDENKQKVKVYLSTPDGNSLGVLNLSYDANTLTRNTVEHWKEKRIFRTHWNKEEFKAWIKSMVKLGQVQNEETYQGSSNAPESLNLHFIPFKQGMLYIGDISPMAEEKLILVKALAEAFSIAYARYEDFKNLEEAKLKTENTLKELKAAQAQLIHSEKMASLGELTAGIAHEIQNPLNFVNNFSELSVDLLQEMDEELKFGNTEEVTAISEDLKQNLQKINYHGKRASSIVKGMLEHSRASGHEKQKTDINKLVDEYLRLSFHGLRAKDKSFNSGFQFIPDESLPEIMVISQDIGRVFLNIINNAFYAVSIKSKSSHDEFHPLVEVSTRMKGNNIEVHIKDNGDGIPASAIDKIFQPFFTTKPPGQGTGLGLSLSYDIVTKGHNGKLEVETKEGFGTEFIITLPI